MDIKQEQEEIIIKEEYIPVSDVLEDLEWNRFKTELQAEDFNTTIKNHETIDEKSERSEYYCADCRYMTKHKASLKTHIKQHLRRKPSIDEQPHFKTLYKHTSIQHVLAHSSKKLHYCKLCDFKTLKRHCKKHTDEKLYHCAQCDYKAVRKYDLTLHILAHRGEKPFRCTHCDFKTASKYRLQRHILTHTAQKSHHCKQCDFKTIYKYTLRRHLAVHTREKPYHCEQCDYETTRKYDLTQHLLVHDRKQPFQCKQCDYKNVQKYLFNRHLKVHLTAATSDLSEHIDDNERHYGSFTIKVKPSDLVL